MTTQQATEILRLHNEWRRGADTEMTDPFELGQAIDMVVEVLSKSQWISVDDRLPDDMKEVMVTDGREFASAWYDKMSERWFADDGLLISATHNVGPDIPLDDCITHWMPSPEMPTGKTK